MIIKNIGKSATGGASAASALLKYLFKYTTKPDKILIEPTKTSKDKNKPFIYLHNMSSRSIKGFTKEFLDNARNAKYKSSRRLICHHTIISFAHADAGKITKSMLRRIVRKYITIRGSNLKYVITQHHDKENLVHLHIAQSANTIAGLSARLTKAAFGDLKLEMDQFQRTIAPDLISLPDHGKSKRRAQSPVIQKAGGRQSKKEELGHVLEDLFRRSPSKLAFLQKVKRLGYTPYYRGTSQRLTGIADQNGRKYRFRLFGFTEERLNTLDRPRELAPGKLEEFAQLRQARKEPELQKPRTERKAKSLEEELSLLRSQNVDQELLR